MTSVSAPVSRQLEEVEKLLATCFESEVPLANSIGRHILEAGGKRLRPLLCLLAAGASGNIHQHHIHLAAVVEYLHTASVLHDDVIDQSTLRRGLPSANAAYDNSATILTGDLIYSQSFEMLVEIGNLEVMKTVSRAVSALTKGELLQLMNIGNSALEKETYFRIIESKTAALFIATTRGSALLSYADTEVVNALGEMGRNLGICFQLIDDLLDYQSTTDDLGKPAGGDLREKKVTLPLIYLLENSDDKTRRLIEQALNESDEELIQAVIRAVCNSDAMGYLYKTAEQYCDKGKEALAILAPSKYRDALENLLTLSLSRNH